MGLKMISYSNVWPENIPMHMDFGDETILEGLNRQAQERPNEVGLEFLGRSQSWGEIAERSSQLAGALQSMGIKHGDRVALVAQNCPHFAIALHAVLKCGAVIVPINPMNKANELAHCIQNSGARIAISSVDLSQEIVLANEKLPAEEKLTDLITFSTAAFLRDLDCVPEIWRGWLCTPHELPALNSGNVHDWDDLLSKGMIPNDVSLNANDLALLMYTSGTTGAPKACMHTHRTIMSNVVQLQLWQDLQHGDISLLVLPMFHITGLVAALLTAIYGGVKTVILPRWDRKIALAAISENGVTHWSNIPTMVVDMLAEPNIGSYDLSSLRHVGGGGAAMPAAVAVRLKEKFGLDYYEGYGLTETAAPTHVNPSTAPKNQCLGIPIANTQARIIGIDSLTEVAIGQDGEIIVSGPQVFLGYWNNAEATKAAFLEIDGRKWFRTGDLGRMDEEGYYFIADRLKRMINASGFKVWPAEVEGLLHGHPSIQEVCIISAKDPYRGETTKALIVLRDGTKDDTTSKDIVLWAKENMSAYKVPKQIEFVESLLKGPTGKISWRALQEIQDLEDGNPTA
jgi:fatty-acyl-CoA synthase